MPQSSRPRFSAFSLDVKGGQGPLGFSRPGHGHGRGGRPLHLVPGSPAPSFSRALLLHCVTEGGTDASKETNKRLGKRFSTNSLPTPLSPEEVQSKQRRKKILRSPVPAYLPAWTGLHGCGVQTSWDSETSNMLLSATLLLSHCTFL